MQLTMKMQKKAFGTLEFHQNLKEIQFAEVIIQLHLLQKYQKKCTVRHNSVKSCLNGFIEAGSHYFRARSESLDLNAKVEDLKKFSQEAKIGVNNLITKKKQVETVWKNLKKHVSASARRYLITKEKTKSVLANQLHKGAVESQILKEINVARSRYQVAIQNLNFVKKRILELVPDAEEIIDKAFVSADSGKHRQELEKLKINS